jgi:hypothetical protein
MIERILQMRFHRKIFIIFVNFGTFACVHLSHDISYHGLAYKIFKQCSCETSRSYYKYEKFIII